MSRMIHLVRSPGVPPPLAALGGLAGSRRPFLFLSAAVDERFGRFSFAGCDPRITLTTKGRRITIENPDGVRESEGDPFEAIRSLLAEHRIDAHCEETPMPAGAAGFLSYDLGRMVERLPSLAVDDLGLPDLCLSFYDTVLTWDHETGDVFATSIAGRAAAEALIDRVRGAEAVRPGLPVLSAALRSTFGREEYVAAVSRTKELIAAGDIFQANISQRYEADAVGPGAAIFSRLVGANPASFAAYLSSPCGAEILSASPERFLRVAGREVETTPIKGTRPRSPDRARDMELARELLESGKDRAELVMIVDLLRNDLGRVSEFGSVHVPELPGLTSHPTVHHLHGTVTSRLADGRDIVDLLRSAFPGGSVTGAPKVRAMEIIEETEPFRRGVYTGAIGYFGVTGEADLSVAIRTMVVKDGRATFSVGAGIVADSDPASEYEETLSKGRGLAAALGYML